jgi:3-oxoacyl-[acyl-carrier protein] reductase
VDYTTAKAGIVGLVRGLSVEVASHGVTVNAVAPGIIKTPQSADPVNSIGPTGLAAISARIPTARVGDPREIATAFAFLASDEAAYVTGQVIVVDGGASLSDGT